MKPNKNLVMCSDDEDTKPIFSKPCVELMRSLLVPLAPLAPLVLVKLESN